MEPAYHCRSLEVVRAYNYNVVMLFSLLVYFQCTPIGVHWSPLESRNSGGVGGAHQKGVLETSTGPAVASKSPGKIG